MKRRLADTLTELMEGILHGAEERAGLNVTSLRLTLPMEVELALCDGEWELHADLPGWRWQTGLEAPRGRLAVIWESDGGHERHG